MSDKRCGVCRGSYRGAGLMVYRLGTGNELARTRACPRCAARTVSLVVTAGQRDARACAICHEGTAVACELCTVRMKTAAAREGARSATGPGAVAVAVRLREVLTKLGPSTVELRDACVASLEVLGGAA